MGLLYILYKMYDLKGGENEITPQKRCKRSRKIKL